MTAVDDDGLVFDVDTLEVHAIREDDRYGDLRAGMRARIANARIYVQIDVGFGDVVTPAAADLKLPTLLGDMPSLNVLAYPTETIVAGKAEAMVDLGVSNSRMKEFTDIAMAARRVAFDGDALVAALRATFRRRRTPLPDAETVALSERFVQNARAQANWKALVTRNRPGDLESLAQVVFELRHFLLPPLEHVRSEQPFAARWMPDGPWTLIYRSARTRPSFG